MEKIKKGSGTTDLTVGRPLPQILKFALPLVLGTLFQQLYSFVDTVIVGRCLGTDALGAVGTTYWALTSSRSSNAWVWVSFLARSIRSTTTRARLRASSPLAA